MTAEQYIFLLQGDSFLAVTVCALFSLAALGIGGLILKRRDLPAFCLGIAVIGILSFLFFPLPCGKITLRITSAAAGIFALPGIYFLWKNFLENKLIFAVCGLLLFFLSASALLPPCGWDEQVYQIELLSRYLQNGSKAVLSDNSYSAWPGFLQFFLLPPYICGGLNVPRLFNSLLSTVLAGTLFSVLRLYGRKTAFVLTCAVVLSPVFLILCRSVYAENTVVLFLAGGCLSLYRLRKKPVSACLFAGIFAGIALSVKLTAAGGAAALLYLAFADRKHRRYLPLFSAGACLAALPFYLRVWLCTGNPFYPFAASVFGTSGAVESYHHMLGSARYGMGPLYGTVFGWISTAFAGKIYDGVTNGFQQLVMLGILFAGFYFNRKIFEKPYIRHLLTALVIMYLFWSFTAQQSRFLFPCLFLLAGLSAFVLQKQTDKVRKGFWGLLLCAVLLTPELYPHIRHNFISWRILSHARKAPLRFVGFAQQDNDYIRLLDAVGRTPSDSRILLLFEKRGLYVPRRHEAADPGFQEKYFKTIPENTDAFLKEIKDFDYLLLGSEEKNVDLQESGLEIRQKLHALTASALAEGKLEIILSGKSCHLLRIKRLTKY